MKDGLYYCVAITDDAGKNKIRNLKTNIEIKRTGNSRNEFQWLYKHFRTFLILSGRG